MVDILTITKSKLGLEDVETGALDTFSVTGSDGSSLTLKKAVPWVDARSYTDFATAVAAIGSSEERQLLVQSTFTVSGSITIPSNVTLVCGEGGVITVNTGVTITMNGKIFANKNIQIFSLSGTGVVSGFSNVDKVYPEWWGAAGDGSANDTAPVKAAVATGAHVEFTRQYKVNTEVPLATDFQHLTATDGGRLDYYGSDSSLFVVKAGLVRRGIRISGLRSTNLGAAGGGADAADFFFSEVTGALEESIIENCEIEGYWLAINFAGIGSPPLSTLATGQSYTYAHTDGRNFIRGNHIYGGLTDVPVARGAGIYNRGSGYTVIEGNIIDSMEAGIVCSASCVIANNVVTNTTADNGIYLAGGTNYVVTGNVVENTFADGIACNSVSEVSITGNNILNAGQGAVRIQNCSDVVISGNSINLGANGDHFIRTSNVAAEVQERITIVSNTIIGPGSGLGNPVFVYNSLSTSTDWIISNNLFTGLDTSGIEGAFNERGAFIAIQSGAVRMEVKNNSFVNCIQPTLTTLPLLAANIRYLITNSEHADNTFHFTTAVTTDDKNHGRAWVAIDSDGGAGNVRANSYYSGLITSVTQTGTTGQYTINFSRPLYCPVVSWTSDIQGAGTGSPAWIEMVGGNWTNDTSLLLLTAMDFQTLDSAGAAYWPTASCVFYLEVMETPYTTGLIAPLA